MLYQLLLVAMQPADAPAVKQAELAGELRVLSWNDKKVLVSPGAGSRRGTLARSGRNEAGRHAWADCARMKQQDYPSPFAEYARKPDLGFSVRCAAGRVRGHWVLRRAHSAPGLH